MYESHVTSEDEETIIMKFKAHCLTNLPKATDAQILSQENALDRFDYFVIKTKCDKVKLIMSKEYYKA